MSDANELAERVEAARLTLDAATAQLKTILSGVERLPRAEKVQVTDGLADAFTAVRNAREMPSALSSASSLLPRPTTSADRRAPALSFERRCVRGASYRRDATLSRSIERRSSSLTAVG